MEEEPRPGAVYKRMGIRYRVAETGDDAVVLETDAAIGSSGEVLRGRFDEEVREGRAVLHPECDNCGLATDPDELGDGLCRECRFHRASVEERCAMKVTEPGPLKNMASRALQSGDPRGHLLGIIGDPRRTFHDRVDAEGLLSGAVPTTELLDAMAECPNCGNSEQYTMDPGTGEVTCHCGERMAPPDGGVEA